jgi:hypothetical protein
MANLPQVALASLKDPAVLDAVKSILDYLKDQSSTTASAAASAAASSSSTGLVPGMMMFYPSDTAPSGWILYTDEPLSRIDYPDLYALFGNAFTQAGDLGNTFRLPPGLGRSIVLAGAGDSLTEREFGDTGGEETHVLTTAEMPSHKHDLYYAPLTGLPAGPFGYALSNSLGSWGSGGGEETLAKGGGGSHNNMQPFVAWYAIIKT